MKSANIYRALLILNEESQNHLIVVWERNFSYLAFIYLQWLSQNKYFILCYSRMNLSWVQRQTLERWVNIKINGWEGSDCTSGCDVKAFEIKFPELWSLSRLYVLSILLCKALHAPRKVTPVRSKQFIFYGVYFIWFIHMIYYMIFLSMKMLGYNLKTPKWWTPWDEG